MKPFSAMYFIRANMTKCALLIFMLFLGYGAYLGGLYVTNPVDNFELFTEYYDDKAIQIARGKMDLETTEAFINEASGLENVTLLKLGKRQTIGWKSIMGYENWSDPLTFRNAGDFRIYCEHLGIECDFSSLTSGSMIMSERFAKNKKLEIGDKVDENYADTIYDEFTLRALTKEDGYSLYFIDTEEERPLNNFLLLAENGISAAEFHSKVAQLQSNYEINIFDESRESVEEDFRTFNMIYLFIMILLGIILAVTINAAFVGMYQRRNFEFAVYRAIGISRRRIVGKLVGELLCMDMIALAAGGAVFFFGLYLFNNLALYPAGLYLRYFHPIALFGLLLCNLTVLIPLIITRCRQMLKADICEY